MIFTLCKPKLFIFNDIHIIAKKKKQDETLCMVRSIVVSVEIVDLETKENILAYCNIQLEEAVDIQRGDSPSAKLYFSVEV